jgi:hypothetical protein
LLFNALMTPMRASIVGPMSPWRRPSLWNPFAGRRGGFRACEFVRSKSLLNHADPRLWGCGFAADKQLLEIFVIGRIGLGALFSLEKRWRV